MPLAPLQSISYRPLIVLMSTNKRQKSEAMDIAAYRLLYDFIHDFKTTALHVESEIQRYGIRDYRSDIVPEMKGRKHHDMWVSMKTVSHFNLAMALELMLKLLLFLNNISIPRSHKLSELYDLIPEKFQKQLEPTFQASKTVVPDGFELIAYINTASPELKPDTPSNRDISNLGGFFEYLDKDVEIWLKRYSWELVGHGRYRHYLSDISVFVELINRVMRDIKRF